MKRQFLTIFPGLLLCAAAVAATPDYKIVDSINIGGAARWDYLYMDSAAQRLYVSHGTSTAVINTQTKKVIGTIAPTEGVHGIAIASDLGIGFTSNGATNTVAVFDLKTLKITATIAVGGKPDAIIYDPATHKVVSFNGSSNDASIIDANTLTVLQTVKVGGKPEFAAVGVKGNIYFNVEDTGMLALLDLNTNTLKQSIALKPCEEPTGLAIDARQQTYSVCSNGLMVISDSKGKALGQAKIGHGVDGVVAMDDYAFSANGADGTISVVGAVNGKFATVATLPSQRGARTIAGDPLTHTLYLPTADFKESNGAGRPQGIDGTFRVIVLK